MSEQAKIIAKATISNCFGTNCKVNGIDLNTPFMLPPVDNKIFPEEIENASEYLKEISKDSTSKI